MTESEKTLITTIIPTYRRSKLLQRAIRSVLNQTYPHFQICVYDNASGDDTSEVVKAISKIDQRVKYHCHPVNIGSLKNFLYGMQQIGTTFFSFLSDDDVLLPEFYETALTGFEKYPDTMFSVTASIIMDEKGNVLNSSSFCWKEGPYSPPDGLLPLMKYPQMWTGILFRRDVIEKVGLFDVEAGPPSDMDLLLRIAARFPFIVSLKPGAIYFEYSASSHESSSFDDYQQGWFKMIHNLTEDERISSGVRIYAKKLFTDFTRRWSFSNWLRAIARKNFNDTDKALNFLRSYCNFKQGALILSIVTKICKFFPPACYLITYMRIVQKRFGTKRRQYLQKEFGHYIRLFK